MSAIDIGMPLNRVLLDAHTEAVLEVKKQNTDLHLPERWQAQIEAEDERDDIEKAIAAMNGLDRDCFHHFERHLAEAKRELKRVDDSDEISFE